MGKASSIQIQTSSVASVIVACSLLELNKVVGFSLGEDRLKKVPVEFRQ